jgi:serine/threonine protein phosphatase PrpC
MPKSKSKNISSKASASSKSYENLADCDLRDLLLKRTTLTECAIKKMPRWKMIEHLSQMDGDVQVFVIPNINEATSDMSETKVKRLMNGKCAFGISGGLKIDGKEVMEDHGCFAKYKNWEMYGIFDGFGGESVAKVLKTKLAEFILPKLALTDNVGATIIDEFVRFDKSISQKLISVKKDQMGATGVCVFYNTKDRRIFVANLGACHAVLLDSAGAVILTTDRHDGATVLNSGNKNPDFKRVMAASEDRNKAFVRDENTGLVYVDDKLVFTRAFGAPYMKKNLEGNFDNISGVLSAVPSVKTIRSPLRVGADYYLIMGSKGFWNQYLNDDQTVDDSAVVDLFKQKIKENKIDACTLMLNKNATRKRTVVDNMMLMTIKFKPGTETSFE